jgi:hypothetical protein
MIAISGVNFVTLACQGALKRSKGAQKHRPALVPALCITDAMNLDAGLKLVVRALRIPGDGLNRISAPDMCGPSCWIAS